MKARKSFILHFDSLEILDELTDEQAGQLFKAIKSNRNGEDLEVSQLVKIALSPFKSQFLRDDEKYTNVVNRNGINGSKGGRPKNPSKPKEPSGLIDNPSKPRKAVSVSVSDSVSDSDSEVQKIVKSPKAQKVKFDPLTVSHEKLNQAAWVEWVEYRKSKGKKISEAAAKKQVKFLTDYNFDLQQSSVDQSISNDYQGLFEPKVSAGAQHGQPAGYQQPKPSLVDRVKQRAEQRRRDQEASATGNRESGMGFVARADSDVRVQVREPIRGGAERNMGNVFDGDYTQTNG